MEALGEILSEVDSGRSQATEQLHVASRETRNEMTKLLEGAERQSDSLRRQILGSAELEARNKMLRTLDEASAQIFQDALKRIAEKDSAERAKSLGKLIAEGVGVIGDEAVVACNSKDREVVSEILKDSNSKNGSKLALDENSVESVGGVVLYSKDRSIRFDNTFEARLERLRPQLRRDIAKILTGS